MKRAVWMLSVGALLAVGLPGCGGKNGKPAYFASSGSADKTAQDPDPTLGTSDLNPASNSTAPPGTAASLADPGGQPPAVSAGSDPGSGKGKGDTPINSGAGEAEPLH